MLFYIAEVQLFMWQKGVGGYVNNDGEWVETSVQKTSDGFTLSKDDWSELTDTMNYLSQINTTIRNEPLCVEGLDHLNQMGFYQCRECSPFFDHYTGQNLMTL